MPRRRQNRLKGKNAKGRPPLPRDPAVTDEAIAHRQRMAPGIPKEDLMKQRAGIPLEILATNNLITEPMRLAGEQFGEMVHRWRRMHQVPDGHRQRAAGGLSGEMDPRKVEAVDSAMRAAMAELDGCSVMARTVAESICVDEFMGRTIDRTAIGDRLRASLCEALTALCCVFRVPAKHAA